VPRVLIGYFGAIASLGLQQLFDEMGFEVTIGRADALTTEIAELLPDGVVLNLDTEIGQQVARQVAAAFPAVTVVLCSPERSDMRVYPRFHHGESYRSPLTPALLAQAMSG
jgi:hypothetical protein